MTEIGTVIESSIGPNRDQTDDVRLVKATLSSDEDVQTLQLIGGLDHAPVEGAKVLVLDIGESWKLAIPVTDGTDPTAATGEKYIYSQDSSGAISASIKLKNDGTIELNGNTDTAVAFTRMKTAFDTLKSELNALVTAFNSHVHLGVPHASTTVGPATPVGVPPAADMAPAESATVKLP